jgi:hypothetical protein
MDYVNYVAFNRFKLLHYRGTYVAVIRFYIIEQFLVSGCGWGYIIKLLIHVFGYFSVVGLHLQHQVNK